MSLEISRREKEGVAILDLKGPLTAGAAATALRDTLRQLMGEGRANVVLNLEKVDYIDSTGLGALTMCYTALRKQSGRLALLNLNRRHVELLVLTKLSTVFELFDDEQQAINSFFPNRQIRRFDILNFIEEYREKAESAG
ncbi:MAG: STAS domain-containing protein [Bryobacterales bacterium]|nr:STAS domain-containing protein [Bryobacterales bacterium]